LTHPGLPTLSTMVCQPNAEKFFSSENLFLF